MSSGIRSICSPSFFLFLRTLSTEFSDKRCVRLGAKSVVPREGRARYATCQRYAMSILKDARSKREPIFFLFQSRNSRAPGPRSEMEERLTWSFNLKQRRASRERRPKHFQPELPSFRFGKVEHEVPVLTKVSAARFHNSKGKNSLYTFAD